MSTSVSQHMFGRIELACVLTEVHRTEQGAIEIHSAIDAMEIGPCPFCEPTGLE